MPRIFLGLLRTSLVLVVFLLCQKNPCLAASLDLEYVAGQGDDSYALIDWSYPFSPALNWEAELNPDLRYYSSFGVGKWRVSTEVKVTGDDKWDKLTARYTHYRYPETPYQLWNLGVEHKSALQAWWNQGAKGSWRLKVKGEYKTYPSARDRDYLAGEWELYSESTDPLIAPGYTGGEFWSQTFFDYAVGRALQGDEFFLDSWVLGEMVLEDDADEYTPPWARSSDELSSKLITKISGGWSKHFRKPNYTWQAQNYELQWQQRTSPESSLKFGLRKLEKNYPYELLKTYYSREHLVRWFKAGKKVCWEVGGCYETQHWLDGDGQEEYQIWIEGERADHSLKLIAELEDEVYNQEMKVKSTYGYDFENWFGLSGYCRVGLEREFDLMTQATETEVRASLKLSMEVGQDWEVFTRLEASREWEELAINDDWGLKIGVKVEI
ncbi:MAG: hypothetical protein H0Z38_00435 [Firmicutes bacterium]|nr:hypothetical protein [Bacillota bacterium]